MAGRARERERRDGGRGGSPAWPSPVRSGSPIVGATGYVGAELVRLLDRHPAVDDRRAGRSRPRRRAGRARSIPISRSTGPPRRRRPARRGRRLPRPPPRRRRPRSSRRSSPTARRSSTSGPTSACATRPTIRAGTASSHPAPGAARAPPSTACPSSTAPTLDGARATRRCGSSARRAATRPRRSSRSRRSPGPA